MLAFLYLRCRYFCYISSKNAMLYVQIFFSRNSLELEMSRPSSAREGFIFCKLIYNHKRSKIVTNIFSIKNYQKLIKIKHFNFDE